MTPTVSVITPTKNRAQLLRETLDSVAAQTFAGWEHIIVDDGSTDETHALLCERAAVDSRIRFLRRTGDKAGANVCRNHGVVAARAPYVIFLDSDDLLDPGCLARRVAVIERNLDFDFITFQSGVFIERRGDYQNGRVLDDQLIGDDLARFLYFEAPWIITAPIWRHEALERLGLFDEALLSWQDIELHVRAICGGCRYLRFPEVDHHIRWQYEATKTSVEQRRSPRHLDGAIQVIERLESHVRQGPGMNRTRARGLCSLYFFVAERWVERGDLGPALAAWGRARSRNLASTRLHAAGSLLLATKRLGLPSETAIRKWKGWSRLRSQPEVVAG